MWYLCGNTTHNMYTLAHTKGVPTLGLVVLYCAWAHHFKWAHSWAYRAHTGRTNWTLGVKRARARYGSHTHSAHVHQWRFKPASLIWGAVDRLSGPLCLYKRTHTRTNTHTQECVTQHHTHWTSELPLTKCKGMQPFNVTSMNSQEQPLV